VADRQFFGQVISGGLVAGIVVVRHAISGPVPGGGGPSPGTGGVTSGIVADAPVPAGFFKKLVDFSKTKLGKVTRVGIATWIIEKLAKNAIEKGHFNDPTATGKKHDPQYSPTTPQSTRARQEILKRLPLGVVRSQVTLLPQWLRDP
jgi:hypothetical protein